MPIDYDALAAQNGAIGSTEGPAPLDSTNYAALAAQHGGITAPQLTPPAQAYQKGLKPGTAVASPTGKSGVITPPAVAGSYGLGDEIGQNTQGAGLNEADTSAGIMVPGGKGFVPTIQSDALAAGKSMVNMATAPAQHLYKSISSLSQGDYPSAAEHFMNSIMAAQDPAQPIIDAQLQSSKEAAEKMMESAKKGDALGVAQHAAGIIPLASQVDAAMTQFQQNPTSENLAHVVFNALPVLVGPSFKAIKGIPEGTFAGEETADEMAARRASQETPEEPESSPNPPLWGTKWGPNAVPGVTDQGVPGLGQRIVQSVANTGTKAAANVAEAAGNAAFKAGKAGMRYVVVPAIKGAGAAAVEMTTDAVSNLASNIADSVSDTAGDVKSAVTNALTQAGDAGKALLPKAASIADALASKIKAGATNVADTAQTILQEHMELSNDLIGRNFDKVARSVEGALKNSIAAVKNAATSEQVTGSLRDLRAQVKTALDGVLPPEAINDVVDKVVDEHYAQTHPVSGGTDATQPSLLSKIGNYISDAADQSFPKPKEPPVNAAIKLDPSITSITTPGERVGGGLQKWIEDKIRTSPAGASALAKQDAAAMAKLPEIAQNAINRISGEPLTEWDSSTQPAIYYDPILGSIDLGTRADVLDQVIKEPIKNFNQRIANVPEATAKNVRQNIAQRIFETSTDPGTGEFRPDAFSKNIDAAKAKLGPEYENLNTINEGVNQLRDSISKSQAAAANYQGIWGTAKSASLRPLIGAAIGSPGGFVGAAIGIAAEIGGELVLREVLPRIGAGLLMEPGMVSDLNVVTDWLAKTTSRVPTKNVQDAANRVAVMYRKAVKTTGKNIASEVTK